MKPIGLIGLLRGGRTGTARHSCGFRRLLSCLGPAHEFLKIAVAEGVRHGTGDELGRRSAPGILDITRQK
jgi:hypothetical protein